MHFFCIFFQKYLVISKKSSTFALAFGKELLLTRKQAIKQGFYPKRAFSSAGLEHLPYKQRVGGSNPSTPTKTRGLVQTNPLLFTYIPMFPLPLRYHSEKIQRIYRENTEQYSINY